MDQAQPSTDGLNQAGQEMLSASRNRLALS